MKRQGNEQECDLHPWPSLVDVAPFSYPYLHRKKGKARNTQKTLKGTEKKKPSV
jgi:hypothetical protein